jgi:hypothetical protein
LDAGSGPIFMAASGSAGSFYLLVKINVSQTRGFLAWTKPRRSPVARSNSRGYGLVPPLHTISQTKTVSTSYLVSSERSTNAYSLRSGHDRYKNKDIVDKDLE